MEPKTSKDTKVYFDEITKNCLDLLRKKREDYGDSWKMFRPKSLTDQIYIKAKRIRTVQDKKENKVGDKLDDEFRGIINYSLMALLQMEKCTEGSTDDEKFSKIVEEIKNLLGKKNHDYGEAWREMRISTITDFILVKLLRLRQIENNDYAVIASEQAHASYQDIVNYSIFALVLIEEGSDPMK